MLKIFTAGLAAVDPFAAVKNALERSGSTLRIGGRTCELGSYDRVLVIGAGKATARMAQAVEEILGDRITNGLVIVKYEHGQALGKIRLREAAHPVPDAAGEAGTREILDLVRSADTRTLVLCLLSGGGSALLVSPAPGISLPDKQQITDLLLRSGANISELNAVRKHLSAVKGGRLAELAANATLYTLILSDVLGDRLDVIASGPTAPDGSTFRDAWAVIEQYGLAPALPTAAREYLERGLAGKEPETPKAGAPCFDRATPLIIGGLGQALSAAQAEAARLSCPVEIIASDLAGDAREAARFLLDRGLRAQAATAPGARRCLLAGGETTVLVRGKGKGGRNQEMALVFAREIAGRPGMGFLSAGTDGTDGPTDAAGAAVDGRTVPEAERAGLDTAAYLENNDSYSFFSMLDERTGGRHHIKTGPTGTNVMDLQIIVVEGVPAR